jgi:Bax protein
MKKKALIPLLLILFQMASIAQNSVFNYIDISGNLPSDIRSVSNPVNAYVYTKTIDLSVLDVQNKKQAFINIMLPSILIAKYQLEEDRIKVLALEKKRDPLSDEEERYLANLKKDYKCHTSKELLLRLSTHPTSIVLAQAAIESGWGTSRFYKEANNVFGVWSYSENEPRIKAMEDREGKSVYVRKYDALPESIVSYFKTIARGPYSEFRAAREKISEVSVLISYLEVYSELRDEYVKSLDQLIQYNKLEKYDSYRLKMSDE